MYKLLLCLRYLRTRYIALASIISVTLGVATLIVVNAVLGGFSHEMEQRIHSILADLNIDSRSLSGFPNYQAHMKAIEEVCGESIEAMTATVAVPAMLTSEVAGQSIHHQVHVVGIDERTYAEVSESARYLQHPENRRRLSFQLRESGYSTFDPMGNAVTGERTQMKLAGWAWRRLQAARAKQPSDERRRPRDAVASKPDGSITGDPIAPLDPAETTHNPFSQRGMDALPDGGSRTFDPAIEQHTGLILGIALSQFRTRDAEGAVKDRFTILPGDDVQLTFPTAGTPPKVIHSTFTVVDFYESKMSEYDSKFVFVPLEKLQELRGMFDRATGVDYVTSIQIRLTDGADGEQIRDQLRAATLNGHPLFPPELYSISTWRDKQGPLLAAVEMETAVLNILLFMIIAVAGFGILATFFMIVVEKTKDVGVLKSLGASSRGVMGIFVGYGLSLGAVGSGAGLALGLLMVRHINEIRRFIEWMTGREVFDPTIYYFYEIPTLVNPWTVVWIGAAAIGIAVFASVAPALRAALLRPVEALRYE